MPLMSCSADRDKRGSPASLRHRHEGDGEFLQVYFGRLVCLIMEESYISRVLTAYKIEDGTARQLVKQFDVKKRTYYGNTSMEAEISLLMANQTLVSLWFFLSYPW